jgi:hypothetical protein
LKRRIRYEAGHQPNQRLPDAPLKSYLNVARGGLFDGCHSAVIQLVFVVILTAEDRAVLGQTVREFD